MATILLFCIQTAGDQYISRLFPEIPCIPAQGRMEILKTAEAIGDDEENLRCSPFFVYPFSTHTLHHPYLLRAWGGTNQTR